MKRWGWVHGLLLALFTVLIAIPNARASGTDVVWVTKQVKWDRKTTTVLTGSQRDTIFITGSADSIRTETVDTADWAWDAFADASVDTVAVSIAYLSFHVAGADNGASDTLTYNLEKRPRGTTTIGNPIGYPRNNTLVGAAGARARPLGVITPTNSHYVGVLLWDANSPEGLNDIRPGENFRLVVHGDQSGTTPKLSQVRLFITYPARRASTQ